MLSSTEIRQKYLDFFKEKGHKIVPAAPIVVKGDPTLMFTNAGMNQFKDYFLGNSEAKDKRVADTQKCLRVSGKHNDLEEVGHDHYHHTMFEMLGNWSFGDYFKKEAITWAWELLTETYGLAKDRLYVTVFEGDKAENLGYDLEAKEIWSQYIDPARILNGNKKDNFWEMGEQGPCGPCSEIHFDSRTDAERNKVDGKTLVNNDHPEVIEIWNLVFMEFNRKADRSLEKLPNQHVDTGMGFERLTRVIQGKNSNYDTDVFSFIIEENAKNSKSPYGKNEAADIAHRVIADHIRAVSMCIADGQLPSNAGAGYVVRRILRRAVRYGYSYLNFQEPFMHKLVPSLAAYFKDVFPSLYAQADFVGKVIKEEEAGFFRTLSNGIQNLDTHFAGSKEKKLSGEKAFELYDTFGFPVDLTELICREKGFEVDMAGFEKALGQQKTRSKAAAVKETGDWQVLLEGAPEIFTGYDELESPVQVSRWRVVKNKDGEQFQLLLSTTPFYAESGGQVGDTGVLEGQDGEIVKILDTQKENKLHVHIAETLPANLDQLFTAKVDATQRALTNANHSGTHLLHSALRQVLGAHVAQKGSLVNPEHLRFDFSHFSKIGPEELQQIEALVNEKIREGIELEEFRALPIQEAIDMGAIALFGEKYGEKVRTVIFDRKFSIELCGGTHVKNTGQIGLFKILTESSVAAGVRRVEAVTGAGALEHLSKMQETQSQLVEMLNHPKDLAAALKKVLDENQALQKRIEAMELELIGQRKQELLALVQDAGGVSKIVSRLELPNAESAKTLCFQLKQELGQVFIVLAYDAGGKPGIAVMIDEKTLEEKGLDASAIVRELGREIQGGGGGQKFFATAGGKDVSGLDAVVQKAALYLS